MAGRRKKATGVNITLDSGEDSGEDAARSPDEIEADDAAERSRDEVPTRARAKVHRKDPASGQYAYLYELDGHTWTQEQIAKDCGGGDYEVIVRGPTKEGRMATRTRKMFTVDHSLPRKAPMGAMIPEVHEKGSDSGQRMQQIFESGVLGLLQQQQALTASITNRPHIDWPAMISAGATLLAALKDKKPERDPIAAAREIAALMQEHGAGPKANSALEQLRELLEVKNLLDGNAPEAASTETQLIGLLGPKVLEILSQAQQHDAGRQPARPLPSPAPAPAALPPAPEGPPMPAWMRFFGSLLPGFKRLAQAGRVEADDGTQMWVHDPELYANVLVDQIAPEHLDPLREVASGPTFDTLAFGAFPAMGASPTERAWFTEFLHGLAALVTEDGTEPDETVPEEPGNATVTDAPETTP